MFTGSLTAPRDAARFRHVVFDGLPRRGGIVDFSARDRDALRNRLADAADLPSRLPPAAPHSAPHSTPPAALPAVPRLPPLPLREDEQAFVNWLFGLAGIDGSAYRTETLRRRLSACLRAVRARTVAEARQVIARDRDRVHAALDALVIGVTSFFRDPAVFDHITYTALAQLPRPPKPRRIWSVACSDGAELYSVAILLAEIGLLDGGATLLGTDCRGQAVAHAKAGRYSAAQVRDIPDAWRERYFRPVNDGRSEVVDSIRSAIQWRRADVTRVLEPGGWDLILCRNMAMYLQPHVAGRLWQRLEHALHPGGFLVLGKAERPTGAARLSPVGPCVYRRDKG